MQQRKHGSGGLAVLTAALGFVGIVTALWAAAFVVDGTLLAESARLLVDDAQVLTEVGNRSVEAYAAALFFWAVFLVIGMMPWSRALFPSFDWIERSIFALVLGSFAMVLNIFMPVAIEIAMEAAGAPLGAPAASSAAQAALAGNQEQSYAVLKVLIFFVAGIIVMIAREIASPSSVGR